jgi:hypothetical protein
MLSVVMLGVFIAMLIVIILNVAMLSVVAPMSDKEPRKDSTSTLAVACVFATAHIASVNAA